MTRKAWVAGLVVLAAAAIGLPPEAPAQQPPEPGAEGAPPSGRGATRRTPNAPAPRAGALPSVQWAQPLGQSRPERPSEKKSQAAAPAPNDRRGGDPTAVVPSLRPLLDPAAGGAAGPRPMPRISVRGRVVSRTGRAAAILDVDGTMIGVEAGSRFEAGGQTVEVEDVGAGGTVLRFLDTDRVISR